MSAAELLAIYYVTSVILDDQPELFGSWVLEFNVEYNLVVVGTYILYRNLVILEVGVLVTFIGEGCQGIAYNEYYGYYNCCQGLYYIIAFHNYSFFIFYKVYNWVGKQFCV